MQEQATVDIDALVAEHRKEAKEHEAEVSRLISEKVRFLLVVYEPYIYNKLLPYI